VVRQTFQLARCAGCTLRVNLIIRLYFTNNSLTQFIFSIQSKCRRRNLNFKTINGNNNLIIVEITIKYINNNSII
jgi:hypothetical protein